VVNAPTPSPSAPLDELVNPRPVGGGRFEATFPEGWRQGRGLFGGLVLATIARALELELGDSSRPLRSLSAELCGPTQPGPAVIEVSRLRVGNNVATLSARLVQDRQVQAHATGALARSRGSDAARTSLATPARTPRFDALEPLPVEPPFGPEFARFWDFRNVGPFPLSSNAEPVTSGWIRPKAPGTRRDAASVVASADAWWPARFVCLDAPRPMATVSFALTLAIDPTRLAPDEPLFHQSRELALFGGYSLEVRELWTASGELVAVNQQTMAVIR
jgi:acyl-CoA thioesterase